MDKMGELIDTARELSQKFGFASVYYEVMYADKRDLMERNFKSKLEIEYYYGEIYYTQGEQGILDIYNEYVKEGIL